MTEINSCTKAGQLHESLSQDSECNSAKPSMDFVKASQLLGKNSSTSASSSGRNSSLQSFVPASIYAKTSESSAAARDDITLSKKVSQSLFDSRVDFCLASELLRNHDSDVTTTRERGTVKRDSTPVSMDLERTNRSTSPVAPDSTSEQNVVVIDLTDLTSEGESKTAAGKKEPSMTKPTNRKRKIDSAVAKTKKITYFFEK